MRRRVGKKLAEGVRDALARAEEQRARYRVILEGKDTPFWKEIQARIESRAKGLETKLDEWVGLPERELWAALEQRKMFRFFKDMVNEAEGTIEMLDGRIEDLKEKARTMKEGAIV